MRPKLPAITKEKGIKSDVENLEKGIRLYKCSHIQWSYHCLNQHFGKVKCVPYQHFGEFSFEIFLLQTVSHFNQFVAFFLNKRDSADSEHCPFDYICSLIFFAPNGWRLKSKPSYISANTKSHLLPSNRLYAKQSEYEAVRCTCS